MAQAMKNLVNKISTGSPCYVEYFLQSGLLLDEDVEYILMHYNNDGGDNTKNRFPLTKILLGGFSVAASAFVIKQNLSTDYLAVAASPVVYIGVQHTQEALYRRKQKHNVETLIKTVSNILKMNRNIIEFFNKRSSNSTDDLFNPFTQPVQQLIEAVFIEETDLIYSLREFIPKFGKYVPSLKSGYSHLDNIELDQFTSDAVTSIDDCIHYLQRLCDIYVLVVSNTFTCLAITLCSNIGAKYNFKTDQILDTIVPKMKAMTEKCYNNVSKKFNDVKFCYVTKKQTQQLLRPPMLNPSTRLFKATCDLMAQTSELVEKSHVVYKNIKEDEPSTSELKTLCASIGNLHKQAMDYCQSLEVLHKLYEVQVCKSSSSTLIIEDLSTASGVVSIASVGATAGDASLNSIEPTEDEEYELYIGEREISPASSSYPFDDESRRYTCLFSQELKQKLSTHSRFVAARQKRGVIDEESEGGLNTAPVEVTAEPQYQLPIYDDNKTPKRVSLPPPPPPVVAPPASAVVTPPPSAVVTPPPPPPLPLPVATVESSESDINILQYIRALPQTTDEEVFEIK